MSLISSDTPLGAIVGFVGLLQDTDLSQKDIAKYLSIIDRNSHHLLRIIDDILDLAKVESGKMTIEKIDFSLVEFLTDCSSLMGIRARENGISFEFKAETPLPECVTSDPTRLRQILINVIGNAIKFTQQVELTCRFCMIIIVLSLELKILAEEFLKSRFQNSSRLFHKQILRRLENLAALDLGSFSQRKYARHLTAIFILSRASHPIRIFTFSYKAN